jgi:hypothetical protein
LTAASPDEDPVGEAERDAAIESPGAQEGAAQPEAADELGLEPGMLAVAAVKAVSASDETPARPGEIVKISKRQPRRRSWMPHLGPWPASGQAAGLHY